MKKKIRLLFWHKGRIEVAANLLKLGAALDLIKAATGLSADDPAALQKEQTPPKSQV